MNEKWGQSILLHGNATVGEMDDNNDTFLDRPKGNQINAAYLLDYNDLENSGFGSHFGIQYLVDKELQDKLVLMINFLKFHRTNME